MNHLTFNSIFAIISLLYFSITSFGQSIKDYYIPVGNYNKAMFYCPNKSGERTDMTRVIYYHKNEDGSFDILDSPMFKGKPNAIITKTIQITASEIRMIKSISTTILETNKKKIYEPAELILKMPLPGKIASWNTSDEDGGTQKFTASWTSLMVNGESKKAIKVTSQYSGWKSKSISYYVEGIGLMKTEIIDEYGIPRPSENFDGLSFEISE